MSTPIDKKIHQITISANKYAWERYQIVLDFSENSLSNLEAVIQKEITLANQSSKSTFDTERSSRVWGVYLGEIIRKTVGGIWYLEDSELILRVFGETISPIEFIRKKLNAKSNLTISSYYKELCKKISDGTLIQEKGESQPIEDIPIIQDEQLESVSLEPDEKEEPVNLDNDKVHKKKTSKKDTGINEKFFKRILIGLSIIVGLIIISSLIMSGIRRINETIALNKIEDDLNVLIKDGERLCSLTEQGVNRTEFKSQLATVKSSYNLLEDVWPKSLVSEKIDFRLAIFGWDMALTVWQNQTGLSFRGYIFDEYVNILLRPADFTAYLDLSSEEVEELSYDSAIGVLFSEACDNFYEGKAGIRDEFN